MAAGATYVPIATTTLGSTSTIVSFTSIPSTYTDLRLVIIPLGVNGTGVNDYIQLNSDGNYNYSYTYLFGNGGSTNSSRVSNNDRINIDQNYSTTGATNPSVHTIDFLSYSNTTTYKNMLIRFSTMGSSPISTGASVALWRSTSAINQIDVVRQNYQNSFNTGSTFTLYGIASA